jgi:hypothetical protein
MIDPVTIEKNPRAIPQNALAIIMVNPITSNHGIVKVVEQDSIVAIPDLKSFQVDPPDRVPVPRAVLKENRISCGCTFGAAVNDRELAGGVEELDGSGLGAGSPESNARLGVRPASYVGCIPCDHFGHCVAHGSPRARACSGITVASSGGDIVRRRLGRNGWQKGTGQNAGADCLFEPSHYELSF